MEKHYTTIENNLWLPYRFAVGPVFHRFYQGLMEGKILGNRCPQCGKVLVPARTFCPECYVDMDEWIELAQEGEVVTWSLACSAFYGMPMDPPFVIALIRLDGADCNLLHILGGFDCSDVPAVRKKIKPGTRVRAVWSSEKQGHMMDIQHFTPVK
jgi:uncharacterized OB-fold protein